MMTRSARTASSAANSRNCGTLSASNFHIWLLNWKFEPKCLARKSQVSLAFLPLSTSSYATTTLKLGLASRSEGPNGEKVSKRCMLEILKPAGRLLNRVFAPSLIRIHLLVSQIGAAIGVERGRIQKLQIQTPNSREAPNTKSQ